MPELLILRFFEQSNNEVEWLILSETGLTQGPNITSLSEIPKPEGSASNIALVPTQQLSLHRAKIPPSSPTRMLQAIPFALEDQLMDDVSEVHFALGPIVRGMDLPVIVVKKNLMDQWTAALNQAGLQVDRLVPDLFALPWQMDQWTLLLMDETALVRTGEFDGFSADLSSLPALLQISLDELEEFKPTLFQIYSRVDHPSLPELQHFQTISIEHIPLTVEPFVFLAEQIKLKTPFNLLQGDYQADRSLDIVISHWKIAGLVAATWLGIAILLTVTQLFYWGHKSDSIHKQITTIYHTAFPTSKLSDNPKSQMQHEIDRLQKDAAGGDFLSLLGVVGQVLNTIPSTQMQLTGFTFQNDQLVLEVQVHDFSVLQNLAQALQTKGLIVEQNSATTNAQGVLARLTIK